ncbi:MAG: hypothetical protein OEV66_03140 [Spirochaetia bacterium]|nr:hypothetical protein [Spirochaetia bacterium]
MMNKLLLTRKNVNETMQNINIKFLKKKMRKLNRELDSMSVYLFQLRYKLNTRMRFAHE